MPSFGKKIPPELLGNACTDPYWGTISPARGAMFLTQYAQAPIVEGAECRYVFTGAELRLAEHTFDIRVPEDCVVLHDLRKFSNDIGMGMHSIRKSSVRTIIYESFYDVNKTIGVIHIPEYNKMHQTFGYRYIETETAKNLQVGDFLAKGTVLAHSPAVHDIDGHQMYGLGVNAMTAFLSLPGCIEDGFVFSDEFMERMAPRTYFTATANIGKKYFLLNMYGDENRYQPFPNIGERVRDDGVIIAWRELDPNLSPADMTGKSLRTLDRTFDKAVIGEPGGIVKDIQIYHDNKTNPQMTPLGMTDQLDMYQRSLSHYYRQIISIYEKLKNRRGDGEWVSPELDQLVYEACIHQSVPNQPRKLSRMYRLEPLDEWRVDVTIESIKKPSNAWKFADFFGGKGVACMVLPKHMMPKDEFGNPCDVVIYGGSTCRRANYGRLYEHAFNGAGFYLVQRLRHELGFDRASVPDRSKLRAKLNHEFVEYAFNELMDFYKIVAIEQYRIYSQGDISKRDHVEKVLLNGCYLYQPVDFEGDLMVKVRELKNSRFMPHMGPVEFQIPGMSKPEKTQSNVLIAPLYLMLLEKIGDDWSAVASVKTQQHGLPAKLNNNDRNATPGRESATRSMGESETRSYVSTCGPEATYELIDQTNSPLSHMEVIHSIYTAKSPSNIEKAVDRNKIPYGGSRPVQLMNNLLYTRGRRLVYKPQV